MLTIKINLNRSLFKTLMARCRYPPPGGLVTMAESWTFPAPAAGLARTVRAVLAVALVGVLALAFPESARAQAPSPSVCDRTPEVRTALVDGFTGLGCADITAAHLASLTGGLSLDREGITSIKSGDFNGLSSIEEITLSNNSLTELPEGIFDDMASLSVLSLNNSRLQSLRSDIFDHNPHLNKLDLLNNSLRDLPSGILDQLKQLSLLDLSANRFTGLPANAFAQLGDLVRLNLSENPITSLPAGVFE